MLKEKNNKKIMNEKEMISFINSVGRSELFDEIEFINDKSIKLPYQHKQSKYLKAVRVSLISLGYNEEWVETTFRDALEEKYLTKTLQEIFSKRSVGRG